MVKHGLVRWKAKKQEKKAFILENLLISEDMNVREGQNIGYVSNDNIIHFEIWGNNQKLNPEKWLVNGN